MPEPAIATAAKKIDCHAFVWRTFEEPKPHHLAIPMQDIEGFSDLNSHIYDWHYYGKSKYGRYAYCHKTGARRGLTMGEFYGGGTVD